jgi:hypothetical protein
VDGKYTTDANGQPVPFDHFPEEPCDTDTLYAVVDGCEMPFKVKNVKIEKQVVKNDAAETVDGRDRYDVGGVEAEKIIASVMESLWVEVDGLEPVWDVANALKYLLRIGSKDPWTIEAHKAENYLHHARTGEWL